MRTGLALEERPRPTGCQPSHAFWADQTAVTFDAIMKRVLAVLILFVVPTAAVAQRLAIGLKAGGGSTVFTQRSSGGESRWGRGYGAIFGAGVTFQLTRILGVRGEALLAERDSDGGIAMRVRYHEFPLLVVLTPPGRFSNFSVLLGATTGLERACHLIVWDVGGIPEDPTPARPREMDCLNFRANARNFGYTGGLQYAHGVAGGAVEIDLRLTDGRSNLSHSYTCCSLTTRSLSLTIGYSATILR